MIERYQEVTRSDERAYFRALTRDPCAYCGERNQRTHQVDHIEPISRGGSGDDENLTAACRACNLAKGKRRLMPFIWKRGGLNPRWWGNALAPRDYFERRRRVGVASASSGQRASTVEERRGDNRRGEAVVRKASEPRLCVPTRKVGAP